MDELAGFNSRGNRLGERYRVLVADALTCSEGVSFFAVRRVHLADVPATPSAFIQSVGRAIRMYGHHGLPKEQQTVTTLVHVAGLPRWMRSPLGAWAFRAQRRHMDSHETESKAKRLLRRLLRVHISDLETLKARLNACCKHAPATGDSTQHKKAPLGANEIAAFMEQIGLWEEAKFLRSKVRKQDAAAKPKRRTAAQERLEAVPVPRPLPTPQTAGQNTTSRVPPPPASRPVPTRPASCSPAAALRPSSTAAAVSDDDALSSLLLSCLPPSAAGGEAHTPRQESGAGSEAAWRRDPLACAIVELHLASSAAEAAEQLSLSARTADEEALRQLARRSQEYVLALAELRAKAVDRAILQRLAGEELRVESEGESSALDFGVSGSSGKEGASRLRSKELPLVLPPGWRTESFRRGRKGRECREVVDPMGRRYRTTQQARRAIDAARGMENVAQQLRSRFAATLVNRAKRGEVNGSALIATAAQKVASASISSKRMEVLCAPLRREEVPEPVDQVRGLVVGEAKHIPGICPFEKLQEEPSGEANALLPLSKWKETLTAGGKECGQDSGRQAETSAGAVVKNEATEALGTVEIASVKESALAGSQKASAQCRMTKHAVGVCGEDQRPGGSGAPVGERSHGSASDKDAARRLAAVAESMPRKRRLLDDGQGFAGPEPEVTTRPSVLRRRLEGITEGEQAKEAEVAVGEWASLEKPAGTLPLAPGSLACAREDPWQAQGAAGKLCSV